MAASVLTGKTALVTGASSGLGVDFARELARLGCRLVLVARREDALKKLQAELKAAGTEAIVVPADLSAPDAPQQLFDELKRRNEPVDVLINNAGFGAYGLELDIPWDKTRQMLMVDIVALTHMTKLFAREMAKRKFGYILQVASIGAYQPSPTYAAYSAAKSYVLSFGEALNYELRGSGVSCTVVSPGVTETEFLQVAGQKRNWFHNSTMMSSAAVAAIGVRAMLKRRSSIVTGFMNALTAFSTRFMPREWLAAFTYRLMRN